MIALTAPRMKLTDSLVLFVWKEFGYACGIFASKESETVED